MIDFAPSRAAYPPRPWGWRNALVLLAGLAAGPLAAQSDERAAWAELRKADQALGAKLQAEHRCTQCHVGKVGGDGSAIYRPGQRIKGPAGLLAMVEMCNTELKLQLFPEDVAAIAAVLNRDHYKFSPPPP